MSDCCHAPVCATVVGERLGWVAARQSELQVNYRGRSGALFRGWFQWSRWVYRAMRSSAVARDLMIDVSRRSIDVYTAVHSFTFCESSTDEQPRHHQREYSSYPAHYFNNLAPTYEQTVSHPVWYLRVRKMSIRTRWISFILQLRFR